MQSFNHLLCFSMVLFVISGCDTPEFEGTVTYTQRVISKNESIDETDYNTIFGDTLKWTYSKGSFLETNNGTGSLGTLYLADNQLGYTLFTDRAVTRNISSESRALDSLYFTGREMTILQRSCTELTKVINGVQHRYWVSSELLMNKEKLRSYKLAFTDRQYALASYHYLRYEYESSVFMIVREAVSIRHHEVNTTLWTTPELLVDN